MQWFSCRFPWHPWAPGWAPQVPSWGALHCTLCFKENHVTCTYLCYVLVPSHDAIVGKWFCLLWRMSRRYRSCKSKGQKCWHLVEMGMKERRVPRTPVMTASVVDGSIQHRAVCTRLRGTSGWCWAQLGLAPMADHIYSSLARACAWSAWSAKPEKWSCC